MADNITYRFIQNVGDYFPSGYFSEDFITKVQNCAGYSADEMKALCTRYVQIRGEYEEYKNFIINSRARIEDEIKHTHDWHTTLLKNLGYDTDNAYHEAYVVKDGTHDSPTEIIPVRHIIRSGEQISMLIMEMQHLISVNDNEPDGLFKQQYEDDRKSGQQRYYGGQWKQVIPTAYLDREKYHFSPSIINKAITQIFLMPDNQRPHYILMLAGNTVFLFDKDKWARGSYLQFSLDDLYFQGQIKNYRLHYALFHLLCSKETLAADGQTVLMDTLIEESYKSAYEVTKDLKEGVVFAVETLANEALYYMKHVAKLPFGKKKLDENGNVYYDETDDSFESEVKDDCLTIIYRLLFLFYAESREELEILPIGDEVYKLGYSLESLRDLEMMRLNSQASRDGYFFDDSIRHLFGLLAKGHHAGETNFDNKSFRVRPIDSPLFNNKNLHHLGKVRIRNIKWQEIIRALSLSKKKNYCGRISYANLGVNQLGSVYESLLAFRGFYAEEDYIEVHKAGKPEEGTFLVPYSRMEAFDISSEVLCDEETGEPKILPKGTFVYRLNGRDRQKSASYYTPEVLTRSTVKYTLKSIIDEVRDNKRKATELLELKILEPAMGAAAFQNEVINQLAEAYLLHQQRQQREAGLANWRISPDQYRNELQKVKAYIATHNVYGVDLNPTAVELGKLSLWLNVIHKDMETPFFANRICVGNAVIGAWLKVYGKNDVVGIAERNGKKLKPNNWWERAPHKVKFFSNRVNRSVNDVYHFLLPDKNMLGVRSIKEQKKAHPEEEKRMATIMKDWTAPISSEEFRKLQRLSAKIDVLLKDYFTDQISIEKYTNNRREIWDGIDHSNSDSLFKAEEQADSYARKQELFDTRYGHNNAYRKLKLAMDYWCALWFWEYKDAMSLPTRQEYWADIEALLDVDDDKLDRRTRKAINSSDLFSAEPETEYGRLTEEQSEIIAKTQEEMLTEAHGVTNIFSENDPLRLKIVCRLAERYRFFHPMLEFIEVFWLRDGFDIICGNPPFLKWQFEAKDVISDKYPEVIIREQIDAPTLEKKLMQFLSNESMNLLYNSENIEVACMNKLLNSPSLYPYLKGQQTDLFKCIICNSLELQSPYGFMGLIHPNEIFEETKGQILRKFIYPRLLYRFQFQNALLLFEEVEVKKIFNSVVYKGSGESEIGFYSINNLIHPTTIDSCFSHRGNGICEGKEIYTESGRRVINTKGHRNRIIFYNEKLLKFISSIFEGNADWESCSLVSIHSIDILDILNKLESSKHVSDYNQYVTVAFDATVDVKNGTIVKKTKIPELNKYEMIFYSAQINIMSPFYMAPRCNCMADYTKMDMVDYSKISSDFIVRTNYIPGTTISDFKSKVENQWIDSYKVGFRKMLDQLTSERTLRGCMLPQKSTHTNSIISISFEKDLDSIIFLGISSSIVFDFYTRVIAAKNLTKARIIRFPYEINSKFKNSIAIRTLRLNCVNKWYANLWENNYSGSYRNEEWSINDRRLSLFKELSSSYGDKVLLRNEFERRLALIELDVLTAMSFGLSLEELIYICSQYFQISMKFDETTWYDINGMIVFSARNSDLSLSRKIWEEIRGEQIDENTYRGTSPTHTHTIDPAKSELYGGQQQTFVAPYTRCDRIADYRTAWAHFEKIFNK